MNSSENKKNASQQEVVKASYKATIKNLGTVVVEAPDLSLELNQMVVWIMTNPDAELLIPSYQKILDMESSARVSAK